jgi:hypothetical protein
MPTIIQPPLPKFDTTSLNADLANKIKAPELQPTSDENGNLRSMIKDQSKQLGTNIGGTLTEFDKNVQAQTEQFAASVEAESKKIEEEARAAAKMIQDELKRKKEEAKKAIEDAKKQAKEAYQKALTAKEKAEDVIAKLKGYKIPRLKKLKPVPTKDLPAPPQFSKYMDADAKKEYAETAKSSATKGEPPAESLVSKPEIKVPNYKIMVEDMRIFINGGDYFTGKVWADGIKILNRNFSTVTFTKQSVEDTLKLEAKKIGFFANGKSYPPNPSFV